ncbi:MAG: hypothetical protein HND49_10245 [Planctomycetes bacterium]|nr:hypothetical protein [Planctomycetota bacterium]
MDITTEKNLTPPTHTIHIRHKIITDDPQEFDCIDQTSPAKELLFDSAGNLPDFIAWS